MTSRWKSQTALCPVCRRKRAVRQDGTMRAHLPLGVKHDPNLMQYCEGTYRKPQVTR